jgi:hypothetical protein
VVGGRKGYWTKGCSLAQVAQEGLYRPSRPASWAPPYAEAPRTNPLFAARPWCENGYENCEFFRRPNSSELHVWCSWHGGSGEPGMPQGHAPHFIVDLQSSPFGTNWTYAGALNPHNASDHASPTPGEPTPVYEDGLPGDEASVRYFIARMPTGKGTPLGGQLGIGLYRLSWVPPGTPPPAAATALAMKSDDDDDAAIHEVVLQAKTTAACKMQLSNYLWIPKAALATLGMDTTGSCGGETKPCGSLVIDKVNRSLAQINPHDGRDACQLCGCDLAYIQFQQGQPRFPEGLHVGAKVKMAYSTAPGPAPSPQPPPPAPGPRPPHPPPPGPAPAPRRPDRELAPKAYTPLPLGTVAPRGWVLEQLLLQANSLAGKMAKSQFPGAKDINQSAWVGGPGTGGNTIQWLPYWTNGMVPLVGLLEAAGPNATGRLDPRLRLIETVDTYMEFVLTHANKSSGLIGPWQGEGGHWGWDPLNMLRSLYNYMQFRPEKAEAVAKLCMVHLQSVYDEMASGDKQIQEWAKMRWPSFVDVLQWAIDELVPAYGGNADVMPLGAATTIEMLHNASDLWRMEGFAWATCEQLLPLCCVSCAHLCVSQGGVL